MTLDAIKARLEELAAGEVNYPPPNWRTAVKDTQLIASLARAVLEMLPLLPTEGYSCRENGTYWYCTECGFEGRHPNNPTTHDDKCPAVTVPRILEELL